MNKVNYLNNLTPMRGIAALLTVVFHVDLMLGDGGDMLLKQSQSMLISRMYLMVDFFFILSGFIMWHVYGKMFIANVNAASFKKFTLARFARVYPLHFVTLFFCVLLFFVSKQLGLPDLPVIQTINSPFNVITNVLLLHSMNAHNWFSWNHASWSISVEWWAYMLFPFLVAPISKMNATFKTMTAVFCFIGYLVITFFIIPIVTVPAEIPFVKEDPDRLSINVSYQYGFVRCLCGFVLGMMVYQAYQVKWGLKFLSSGYVLLLLALCTFSSMHFNLPDVISILPLPFILLCGAYGSSGIDRFFANPALQRLGDWSFSIYLVHEPLLYTIACIKNYINQINPPKIVSIPVPKPTMLEGWAMCIGFIILTIGIAFLTYRFIEVPARNRINRKQLAA